jgi:hypothetical protein
MAIVPDTKNWTWVLERECPECGFDSRATGLADIPRLVRENAAAWPTVLARPDVAVRPDDATWSALEYSCHVRDMFRVFRGRLELMLEEDEPAFANWDQDLTAVEQRYGEQDPAAVDAELAAAAEAMALALEAVPSQARDRRGLRSDGSVFTVETLARYFVHDPIHHLHDVHG